MKKRWILIFWAIFSVVSSCAYLTGRVRSPTLDFKQVEIKDVTFRDVQFAFHFDVRNPNAIPLTANQVQYHLRLNKRLFTEGTFDKKITLPPQKSTVLVFPIRVQYKDLMHSLQDILQDQSIQYDLEGSVRMGSLSVPFHQDGQVQFEKEN